MHTHKAYTPEQLRYLKLLSHQYPTVQAAGAEVIRLKTILNLPKGTEHFLSDIHGEYEAFLHILNSASGEAKEKLAELFGDEMSGKGLQRHLPGTLFMTLCEHIYMTTHSHIQ